MFYIKALKKQPLLPSDVLAVATQDRRADAACRNSHLPRYAKHSSGESVIWIHATSNQSDHDLLRTDTTLENIHGLLHFLQAMAHNLSLR